MQELKVIGVEQGSLLLVAESGERFQLALHEVPNQGQRPGAPARGSGGDRSLPPREIQRLIRSGLSAEQVAASSGADLEYVRRFEGPVLDERQFIVASAQSVPVHAAADTGGLGASATFGERIRQRLDSLGAGEVRWDSWREAEGGWVIQLAFTAHAIDHDARWSFDPRRRGLAPQNTEASALSQQGDALPPGQPLLPRLRSIAPEPAAPDSARFDSGAFRPLPPEGAEPRGRAGGGLAVVPGDRGPEQSPEDLSGATEELLETLRRRRGERQPAPGPEQFEGDDPGITMIDVPIDAPPPAEAAPARPRLSRVTAPDDADDADDAPTPTAELPVQDAAAPARRGAAKQGRTNTTGSLGRRGRAAMPSWDEIVFGTRPEE